jgi:hypothetical protein
MWLLVFALLALLIGHDLRQRGSEACLAGPDGSPTQFNGLNVCAVGGWTSVLGGICLNIAVWSLF